MWIGTLGRRQGEKQRTACCLLPFAGTSALKEEDLRTLDCTDGFRIGVGRVKGGMGLSLRKMGNYRFKLSDMVPNAWFYKLKDMGKSRSQIKRKQTSSSTSLSTSSSSIFYSSSNLQQHHRKSYYFSRTLSPNPHQTNVTLSKHIPTSNIIINFSETPTKSSKKRKNIMRRNAPKCVNSPFSSSSSEPQSSLHSPKSMILSPSHRRCNDHILDSVLEIDLPPIITKPNKKEEKTELKCITVKTEQGTSPKRRISVSSSSIGVKLRTKSPRIVSRKSVSSRTSYAVVKSSKNPQKDFKESMVEMIVKNNIKTSKDLEELLACYLSLNSDHYHNLIIKVFKQIWFGIQLK
ncbi:hypothetical protein H5410_045610 [Solanum commersonii]|uniref:Transcription repressor n=1 Tax=Solanum commersonii TaxID=4109 RepID=A0A9J5XE59_SOLCO|nr:hypothetical protein H5410_045610 [Solanum commersonii]